MAIKDSLSLSVIGIYDFMDRRMVNRFETRINDESIEMVNIFRDNYDWYPEYMSKTIMQDNSSTALQDYFLCSTEYRCRVISNYQLIYNNYLRILKSVIPSLKKMKEDLNLIIEGTK